MAYNAGVRNDHILEDTFQALRAAFTALNGPIMKLEPDKQETKTPTLEHRKPFEDL